MAKLLRRSRNFKRRIEHRLRPIDWQDQPAPMFAGANVRYEIAERTRGIESGGIGAIHQLARKVGLPSAINSRLKVLKRHLPY